MLTAYADPSKKVTHKNSVLKELREMQQVAFRLITSPDTKPSDVAQLMRAHVAAEQQRNVLRMRPAPKPIDVTTLRKSKSKATLAPEAPQPGPTAKPQEG